MLSSGLLGRFWFSALSYATVVHNITYAVARNTSPHLLLYGEKPDISNHQQFGVEGWIYRREEQRNGKFDARGEPCIFVGYPSNQLGYLVWCPARGPNAVVSTTNVFFGSRLPRATTPSEEIMANEDHEIPLPEPPSVLQLEELQHISAPQILGTYQGQFVIGGHGFENLRLLAPSQLMSALAYTHEHRLSSAHLSLVESYALYDQTLPANVFSQEVASDVPVPRNLSDALSPQFIAEFGPAIDKENAGFVTHECFEAVPLPAGARCLPTQWLFNRKRDGTAKARLVVCGHRQVLGKDYFENKNYCSVLSSRDNRILLSLAAAQNWYMYQTDVVQAFLHGALNDVDIYIQPPARYACPPGLVLKLRKAVYGLHQAPVKFKQEVTTWFRDNGYQPANDSETVWIKRVPCKGDQTNPKGHGGVIVHALYADDFLHFTDNPVLYQSFKDQFKKRFDIKTGSVSMYLGNRVTVDRAKQNVVLDQTEFVSELLEKFGMKDCNPAPTPMIARLSAVNSGEKLNAEDHELYRTIVGSLLYLSCWSRPDISFAVSELSRFVAAPGHAHLVAAKHLLRYLKGTYDLGIVYSRPGRGGPVDNANTLWGYVDSDWAGCPDSRRSTSGYVLVLNGAAVAWKSKRQSVVALSSAEAEFVAASAMVQEVIYIRRFLENLGFPQKLPTVVYEDNRTCVAWSEGSVGGSDRAKHIDLREHFVHDAVQRGSLKLRPIASASNVADLLTKPLSPVVFSVLRKALMGY